MYSYKENGYMFTFIGFTLCPWEEDLFYRLKVYVMLDRDANVPRKVWWIKESFQKAFT